MTEQMHTQEAVADAFRQFCIHDWNKPSWWGEEDTHRFVARLSDRVHSTLAASQEPVGYSCEIDMDGADCFNVERNADARHTLPVYLSPAASSQERIAQLEALADEWEAEAKALPLGHEHIGRGKSSYNWYRYFIGKVRERATRWPAHPDQTSPMTVGPEAYLEARPAAALGAQPRTPEPEGWKLVPVEPTREMAEATMFVRAEHGSTLYDNCEAVWSAMLAAAPVGAAK